MLRSIHHINYNNNNYNYNLHYNYNFHYNYNNYYYNHFNYYFNNNNYNRKQSLQVWRNLYQSREVPLVPEPEGAMAEHSQGHR